jgi:putative sterol carrier protein
MTESNQIINLVNETLNSLNEKILLRLQEWGKTVLLTIDNEDFFIDFSQKNPILKNGRMESFDFKIITSLNIITQMIRSELNPVEAVVSGEVTIEGSLTDALEFSEIMTNN